MEAATAERNEAAPEPTTGKAYTFISRGRHERLVRAPKIITRDELGAQHTRQEGHRIEFGPDGTYVAHEGRHILIDSETSLSPPAELEARGLPPAGEARDEVQWLRGHPQFNIRFHEEGAEPDRPRPFEEDFMAALTQASIGRDLEAAETLRDAEKAGHNRPALVKAAESAAEQIAAALAVSEAPPEAEQPTVEQPQE